MAKQRQHLPIAGNWNEIHLRKYRPVRQDAGWVNHYDEPSPVEMRIHLRVDRFVQLAIDQKRLKTHSEIIDFGEELYRKFEKEKT